MPFFTSDDFTKVTALAWLDAFILLSHNQQVHQENNNISETSPVDTNSNSGQRISMLGYTARLLLCILPNLSSSNTDIKEAAAKANQTLLQLITQTATTSKAAGPTPHSDNSIVDDNQQLSAQQPFPISDVINTIILQFLHPSVS
jgi:hypothetical protein